jgi:hypothetical protein
MEMVKTVLFCLLACVSRRILPAMLSWCLFLLPGLISLSPGFCVSLTFWFIIACNIENRSILARFGSVSHDWWHFCWGSHDLLHWLHLEDRLIGFVLGWMYERLE